MGKLRLTKLEKLARNSSGSTAANGRGGRSQKSYGAARMKGISTTSEGLSSISGIGVNTSGDQVAPRGSGYPMSDYFDPEDGYHIPEDIDPGDDQAVVSVSREGLRPIGIVGFESEGRSGFISAKSGAQSIAERSGFEKNEYRTVTTRPLLCRDCEFERMWSSEYLSYFCPLCERDEERGR